MPHRILIVEDEIIIGLDLMDMLEDAGYETVGIARDMQAALRMATSHDIDLATMDIRLACGSDGVETAIRLWEEYEIPSLFVSASLDPATHLRAAPAQPLGFVQKPIGSYDIVTALNAHFDTAG